MKVIDLIGVINGWTITRLPKNFDHKYKASRDNDHAVFNDLKVVIDFTGKN